MNVQRLFLSFVLLGLICLSSQAQLEKPVPYQGTIADSNGTPYTGNFNFIFELQDANGLVWWSSDTVTLAVDLGAYSVILGEAPQPPVPLSVWRLAPELFLHISFDDGVNGMEELDPAVEILYVPWSISSCFAYGYYGDTLKTKIICVDTLKAKKIIVDTVITKILCADTIKAKKIIADTLIAEVVCADTIKADYIKVDSLVAEVVCADTIKADYIDVDSLVGFIVCADTLKARYAQLDSVFSDYINVLVMEALFVEALGGKFLDLEAEKLTADSVVAKVICVDTLKAKTVIADTLKTLFASVLDLEAAFADIGDLSTGFLTTQQLFSEKADIDTLIADVICADSIKVPSLSTGKIEASSGNLTLQTLIAGTGSFAQGITAAAGEIDSLESKVINTDTLKAKVICVDSLKVGQGLFGNLQADYSFSTVAEGDTTNFDIGDIGSLQVNDLTVGSLVSGNSLDFTNGDIDTMLGDTFQFNEGILTKLTVSDTAFSEHAATVTLGVEDLIELGSTGAIGSADYPYRLSIIPEGLFNSSSDPIVQTSSTWSDKSVNFSDPAGLSLGLGHNGVASILSARTIATGDSIQLELEPNISQATMVANKFRLERGNNYVQLCVDSLGNVFLQTKSAASANILNWTFDATTLTTTVNGNLQVFGSLSKSSGSFKIDHPQDPYRKYLYHSFVESPDMMNVYNGNVVTDESGFASVELPPYFEALNKDFRYQLTVIGTFAQAIVAEEVADNRFVIQTSEPSVKVSWQVTGIRNDPYARENRLQPEVVKEAEMQGKLIYEPKTLHYPNP